MRNHFKEIIAIFMCAAALTACSKTVDSTINSAASEQSSITSEAVSDQAAVESASEGSMPEIKLITEDQEMKWGKMRKVTLDWGEGLTMYYERPVFNESVPGAEKINARFDKLQEEYFSRPQLASIWEYHSQRPDVVQGAEFINTTQGEVTIVSDKYVSGTECMEWYMGGVFNNGCAGYTLDAKTGEAVSLTDYMGKDIAEVRERVMDALRVQISEEGRDERDIDVDKLKEYNDFRYYITTGQIHVVFAVYEIASGAEGPFDVVLPNIL